MSWSCPYDTPSGCSRTGREQCEPRSRGCILLRKFPLAKETPSEPQKWDSGPEEPPDLEEIRRRLKPID